LLIKWLPPATLGIILGFAIFFFPSFFDAEAQAKRLRVFYFIQYFFFNKEKILYNNLLALKKPPKLKIKAGWALWCQKWYIRKDREGLLKIKSLVSH